MAASARDSWQPYPVNTSLINYLLQHDFSWASCYLSLSWILPFSWALLPRVSIDPMCYPSYLNKFLFCLAKPELVYLFIYFCKQESWFMQWHNTQLIMFVGVLLQPWLQVQEGKFWRESAWQTKGKAHMRQEGYCDLSTGSPGGWMRLPTAMVDRKGMAYMGWGGRDYVHGRDEGIETAYVPKNVCNVWL